MDQIKPFLVAFKNHKFWVACGFITLACLVTWLLAAMKLSKDRKEWGDQISGKYSTAKGIAAPPVSEEATNVTAFPNTEVQKGMNELINSGRAAIADAWRQQYQKQSDLFVWPDALPEQARNELRRLRPIEKMLTFPTPPEKEINADYLQAYRDYIKNRLPELASKVGASWIGGSSDGVGAGRDAGPSGGGGAKGGPGGSPPGGSREADPAAADPMLQDRPPIVRWNASNQAYWQEKTTNFTSKNGNRSANNRPLTIQVLYAQEDLWILEAIFDVIKKTNGEADANDLADIKEIDHIFVGKDASAGVSAAPQQRVAPAQTQQTQSNNFGGGNGKMPTGDISGGGGSSNDPADNRYVNQDYQTLLASEIRAAFTNRTPDNAYLAVAKRVPVRIGLQLDERALFEFLANCANAPLTIEVRQVRINRHTPGEGAGSDSSSSAGGGKGGMGGMGGGGKGGMGGMGGGDGSDKGGAPAPGIEEGGSSRRTTDSNVVRDDNVIDVEVYGIVHIYNPVDDERVAPVGETAQGSGVPGSPNSTPVTTTQQPAALGRNDG